MISVAIVGTCIPTSAAAAAVCSLLPAHLQRWASAVLLAEMGKKTGLIVFRFK